jgi:hypothetical protein
MIERPSIMISICFTQHLPLVPILTLFFLDDEDYAATSYRWFTS